MAGVPLFLVIKNAGLALEKAIPLLIAGRSTVRGALGIALQLRWMGIARLLATGTPEELFAELSRGARAFLFFLERAGELDKVTSRADPFFDAIACGDDDAAARIVRASRATWHEGKEYEDDFLHAWYLMRRFAAAPDPELGALLDRWDAVLEGNDDPRLDLCRALQARDQDAFDDALEAVVEEKQLATARLAEADRLPPEDAATTAHLSVELLAVLRLAEAAGLRVPEEVPLAPSVARRLDLATLPGPDDWRSIRSFRELT